jgi:hypothetical protein
VNCNNQDPTKLKEIMERENLNWRSFANPSSIVSEWNNPGTPLYYVLDPAGVIRYKWFGSPGEEALDSALESLLQAAEN